MQTEAIAFLDRTIERQRRLEPNAPLSYNDICYLLTRSSYQDIPLGQTLGIHQAMMEQLKQWIHFSTIEKAYAAITLQRYGFTDVAARLSPRCASMP